MNYKTHLLGGAVSAMFLTMAASEAVASLAPFTTPMFCGVMISCLAGSLAPDIDQSGSKAGKAVKPLSQLMSRFFGHRTFCHSLLFLTVVYIVLKTIMPSMSLYIAAFCVGGLSHLVLDLFNAPGVPLLWPIPLRFRCGKVKTESAFGNRIQNWQERIFRLAIATVFVVTVIESISLRISPFGGGFPWF